MTTVNERQEKLAAEQAYKEHIHHTKINSAAVTDHILANIHTLHVKLHQYHVVAHACNPSSSGG